MKHLTSKILMALVVTGFAGAAHAAVTSKAYVDKQDGDLTTLTTTAKTDLVSAINSVQGAVTTINTNLGDYTTSTELTVADLITETEADDKYAAKATEGVAAGAASAASTNATSIGALASLTTTEKTSLVGAINEIKGILGSLDAATMADLITEAAADTKYAIKATEGVASGAAAKAAANETAIGTINTTLAGKEDKSALKALAYKDSVAKTDLAADVQTSLGKADTALQAAAIENLATKTELTTGLGTKQNTLKTAQQAAVDSGITTAKVTAYDAYDAAIAGKADAAATTASLALKANDADLGALAKAAPGACGNAANKCVLVFDGSAYSWEVIER